MHIAICDDNIADRKQLERLLKRESDNRLDTTGPLHIDSFGNSTALMQSPIAYDIYFTDITQSEDVSGIEIAENIRKVTTTAPIVLCSSKIEYQTISLNLSSIFYLDKPIGVIPLSDMISTALTIKKQNKSTFELRGRTKTIYVTAEDFLYASKVNDRQAVTILHDGQKIDFWDSLPNLWNLLATHPSLVFLRNKYLVNVSYIKKITLFHITLTNGKRIHIRPKDRRELKKFSKNFILQ